MYEVTFSTEIKEILSSVFNAGPGLIAQIHLDYVTARENIPDAPAIEDLQPSDVHGVYSIHNYSFENDASWAEFVARVTKVEEVRDESSNPFLPNWHSKTDDRQTPWLSDTGGMVQVAPQYKDAITAAFKKAVPVSSDVGLLELVGIAPTTDLLTLIDVTQALNSVSHLIVDGIGESTDENNALFRWSRALCTLAGLGLDVLRHFAERLAKIESDWSYWATCTDAELRDDIIEARKISCYPVALLRADYRDLQTICADATLSPRWIKPLLAVHLFKHVRYFRNFDGKPALFAAYRGEYAHIPLVPEGINLRLTDDLNGSAKRSLCSILGIRNISGRNAIGIDMLIDDVLSKIHPRDFAKPRELKDVPHLVVPGMVNMVPSHELRGDYKWINTGLMIENLARIDLETGKVQESVVTGPQVISLAWPRGDMRPAELKTWWANLPRVVKPALPSQILKQLFRNVNDLGHPEGFWAMVDAVVLADLMREDLAGTPVGNSLINEYPLVISYPMGHTKETTTNQGKTSIVRTLVNALVQGVPVTHAGRSSSAPSQRAAASPIEEFGTALYDEFQLPESHEHFLAQAGLQTLSTGGRGGPGRAGENSKGFYLKHPLFFTVKVSAFPPDIRNRTIPIFMDTITEDTRCSPEELAMITSGIVSNVLKLSALMWIRKTNFVERCSAAKLRQGKCRFDGHMTIATLLTKEGKADDINAFMNAAEGQCNAQQLAADDSGLSDNIGISSQFDPLYYFKNCSDYTINQLADTTEQDQVLCLPLMRQIVEDAGVRKFQDIARQHGGKERALLMRFSDAIKSGRMVRADGWYMEWVVKDGVNIVTDKGTKPSERLRECVVIRNKKAVEKTVEKTNPAAAEKPK